MKNIKNISLLALLLVTVLTSCTDEPEVDPSRSFSTVIINGSDELFAVPGATVTIEVTLHASAGIASLAANGVSIEVSDGGFTEDVSYDFTVPEATAVGADVEVTFVLTDADGATSDALVTIITQEDPSTFSQLGSVTIGGEGAAEISAYDMATMQLFVVNNDGASTIDVINFSNPASPSVTSSIDISSFGGGANSVAVSQGRLAVAVEANDAQANGTVLVYSTSSLTSPSQYTVGALPDMVTFTPDGSAAVVANEGEPNDDYTTDPEGSVSIITFSSLTDVSSGTVVTLGFTGFNPQEASLEEAGLRVNGPNATLAQDVEPEFITITPDSETAYVALQENNGLAVVDISEGTITGIVPLGFKDYRMDGLRLDPSDEDGVVSFRTVDFPLFGVYQPDAIAAFEVGGETFIISANEGDGRDYGGTPGFVDEERIEDLTLDATVFADAANFQAGASFGRLLVMTDLGDTDNDGAYEELYTYGARSFSVWSDAGELLWDSGNELDNITLAAGVYADGRSDAKSTEPEGVVVGVINGSTYAFVGLERVDAVAVYDVSMPTVPSFVQLIETGDAPEGLVFIPASESPNDRSLLVVSCEDDGTVYVYQTN
ncbi:MAG: choice-of-anchor I family protein [Bacteroidota bacterium]